LIQLKYWIEETKSSAEFSFLFNYLINLNNLHLKILEFMSY